MKRLLVSLVALSAVVHAATKPNIVLMYVDDLDFDQISVYDHTKFPCYTGAKETGNLKALKAFRTEVNRAWLRALRRRSQKGSKLNWGCMKRLIATWIPSAQILHPYPNQRLAYDPR